MSNTQAGITFKLTCANPVVNDSVIPKGKDLFEQALEDAEEARGMLGDENLMLRKILLNAANEILAMVYLARSTEKEKDPEVEHHQIALQLDMRNELNS